MYLPALALTIDVGGTLGNVSANDFLNVTDSYLLTDVSAMPLKLVGSQRTLNASTVQNGVQRCEHHDHRKYLLPVQSMR